MTKSDFLTLYKMLDGDQLQTAFDSPGEFLNIQAWTNDKGEWYATVKACKKVKNNGKNYTISKDRFIGKLREYQVDLKY